MSLFHIFFKKVLLATFACHSAAVTMATTIY